MRTGGTMPKTMKRFVGVALAIAWMAVPASRAQDKKEGLPAPLPRQIFTAHKVFVSNAGGDTLGDYSGGPDRAYNQFYGALEEWGRYEMVAAPADAELILEVRFSAP